MDFENIYFVGIGGIGMSNLARYFLSQRRRVGGYDRAATDLTESLKHEGAFVHYEDNIETIPPEFLDKSNTLIVYTPAVPSSHSELTRFRQQGFITMKRAQVLGEITKNSRSICVAGTHGKTTVSSMIAHTLHQSHIDCNGFLGGILKNYDNNLILSGRSDITVAEADEYDRSFHWLHPWIAVITSADPDHLDIYGTPEAYRESFEHFTSLIRPEGFLIMKKGLNITPRCHNSVRIFTYSESEGDYHAKNVRIRDGAIKFDFVAPDLVIPDIWLGVPVKINIENAVAALAAATLAGVTPEEASSAITSFAGTKRRFDIRLKTDRVILIDDYAHHPDEIAASIASIRTLYPDKKITGIFQPHLYTRTRDFAPEFARSLSKLDEVILLDIYPAREEPIEGVTSKIIFDRIDHAHKVMCSKTQLLDVLRNRPIEVVVTLGAGDIDRMLPDIENVLKEK